MKSLSILLRKVYKESSVGYYLIHPFKVVYDFFLYRVVPPEIFIKAKFRSVFGYKLDLNNPRTLNEKIQWLKLFYNKTDLHTMCADKLAVKEFVKDTIGAEYVVPLVYSTSNPLDISFSTLPDFPVIVKGNHNSGGYIIIKDKRSVNWNLLYRDCRRWLRQNYYYIGKEFQYKNIPPTIIVEKLLLDVNGMIPLDYKVHCINGEPTMIQVDLNRGTSMHCRNWYNINWEREPFSWSSLYIDGTLTDPCTNDVKKPSRLGEMLTQSSILAKKFPYVRIDWYILDDRLYFGEFTFHHDGGFRPILPRQFDLALGERLVLPDNSVNS